MERKTKSATHAKNEAKRARGARAARITPRPPTQEEIARRAHELYVRSGHQPGRELEFWLEAERQLKEEIKA